VQAYTDVTVQVTYCLNNRNIDGDELVSLARHARFTNHKDVLVHVSARLPSQIEQKTTMALSLQANYTD
jgi:hypothetical protein